MHSCIPETELLSFELDLSRIDAMIIKRLVQSMNGFAMLIILLQLYNQLNEPMREDGIFGRIIGNFAALADHVVDKQMVLIFLIILYRYAQTARATTAWCSATPSTSAWACCCSFSG